MYAQLSEKMKLAKSVQQGIPYGQGLMRSGEVRPHLQGGFAIPPALIAAGVPIVSDFLKRPVQKLTDKFWGWLGLGAGGGKGGNLFRSGGYGGIPRGGMVIPQMGAPSAFWHKPGDIGSHIAPMQNPMNASMSSDTGNISKKDIKNLRVLEWKLKPLASNPTLFFKKLAKMHAKGEGYFKSARKKYKKMIGAQEAGKRLYKYSKRYRLLKDAFYKKHGKSTKYHKSPAYRKHKAAYVTHRQKKSSKSQTSKA